MAPRMQHAALRPIRGAVLVGGRSQRMGTPKSDLILDGRTLLQRVVDTLASSVESVSVIGGAGRATGLTGLGPARAGAVEWLPDCFERVGPLAGIVTALKHDRQSDWLCVACDMPDLSMEALTWLLRRRDETSDMIAARLDADAPVEPLLALYAPTALQPLTLCIREGERSLRRAVRVLRASIATAPAALRGAWRNINTPRQWAEYRDAVRKKRPR